MKKIVKNSDVEGMVISPELKAAAGECLQQIREYRFETLTTEGLPGVLDCMATNGQITPTDLMVLKNNQNLKFTHELLLSPFAKEIRGHNATLQMRELDNLVRPVSPGSQASTSKQSGTQTSRYRLIGGKESPTCLRPENGRHPPITDQPPPVCLKS